MAAEIDEAKKHPFWRTPLKVRVDLLVCLGCVFADYLGDNLLSPSYDDFITEEGPSGMDFGLATSVITLSYILGRAVSASMLGTICDFAGRWNVIVVCTFLTSLGFLLQALAWNYWSLVGFRLFTGLVGGTRPVVIVYISDWIKTPDMLTFWMSLMPVASSVASFVGPLLGGIVVEADPTSPLNSAYVGFALNFTGFLLVLFCVDKSPGDISEKLSPYKLWNMIMQEVHKLTSSKSKSPEDVPLFRSPGPLVEWSAIIPFMLACGLSNAGTQGWSVLLVTLQQDLGFSSLVMGLISGWCGVWIIVGQLLFLPFVLKHLHWTMATLMIFGFAVSTCIIVPAFVNNIWIICVVAAIFSAGLPLAKTGVFTMFPLLCDVTVKGRVMGLTTVVSNVSRCISSILCGVLYDIKRWIPYTMLLGFMFVGIGVGIFLIYSLPKALDHRRRMNLAMAAARTSRDKSESNQLWKKRSLVDRFAFDALEEQHYYYLAPFGAVTEKEVDSLLEMSKQGARRMPRLCFQSKAVIIPDIMKLHLGRWTSKMLEAHGYRNWDACPQDLQLLLENGFPTLRGGAGSTSSERLIAFYNTLLAHKAACVAYHQEEPDHQLMVPLRISEAVSRLRQKPASEPLPCRRLDFGRRLSNFLVEHGHLNWPGLFEDGQFYHIMLRNTFPPLKPNYQKALQSIATLAAHNNTNSY
ncbi:hypothetical protein FOL47_003679 [Perkinsus chesapeaki]|uniref:Major facilitator superfamily (MFS) profile domain-containing protein n=1 Tax=Perkinsus chesapeaki TaxID=330153 RepID=A0A7J6M6R4_PERCH|nr:hypothetical protein FOL47_003679 [Perkinsus chesapeaki]